MHGRFQILEMSAEHRFFSSILLHLCECRSGLFTVFTAYILCKILNMNGSLSA